MYGINRGDQKNIQKSRKSTKQWKYRLIGQEEIIKKIMINEK